MRFPVTIRHRTSTAKIYAPGGKFKYYRVAYTTAGKRRMQTFATYSAAKVAAERIVRDAANGSQAAAFSASQSRDALAALQSLESFRQSTGRAVSLLAAVREFVEAAGKLHGRSLDEAVTGYLRKCLRGLKRTKRSAPTIQMFHRSHSQHSTNNQDV